MRSDRLLSLLLILQARGRVTAPVVAAELEVSVRTVYRDVEALSAAGVPVWTEQGRGGGIALLPGYRTDMTGLTADESRALVALTGRAVPDDLGMGTALAAAVHKLVAAVPASHRPAAEQARDRVLVDHTGWYRRSSPAPHLTAVQEAVWADRRLRVRYRHGDGEVAGYLLDPYGLVVKAGVWYLVAAHRGRARLFRVDRLLAAEVVEAAARRPDDLDLAAEWARLRADVERPRDLVAVRVRVRDDLVPMVLRVTRGQRTAGEGLPTSTDADSTAPTTSEPDPGGWQTLTLTFRARGAAVWALLGFGGGIEVLEPVAVRELLIETARAALTRHAVGS
jgi:predicted DNA-binding transcriptional regulator YafY